MDPDDRENAFWSRYLPPLTLPLDLRALALAEQLPEAELAKQRGEKIQQIQRKNLARETSGQVADRLFLEKYGAPDGGKSQK
jgi:hypothetical protein